MTFSALGQYDTESVLLFDHQPVAFSASESILFSDDQFLYLGGGVGSGEDGLFKFKRAFYKGELNRFHIGKKIFDEEKYNQMLSLRDDISESNFFPKYRA